MITAYEATSDALRRLENAIDAAKSVSVPDEVPLVDAYTRGLNAGLTLALDVIRREQETARRMFAPKGAEVEQYMFMRLHTPVRKA